jgi:Holliday junction DNA helicase RuvA
VGKKTAERLLVELRSRLTVPVLDDGRSLAGSASAVGDVREALVGLGYGADEIRTALSEARPSDEPELLLRDALKVLGARRA